MTLPYAMGDETPYRRLANNSTELLCKLGSILYHLTGGYAMETLTSAEAGREQLLKDLVGVEEEMAKVKGLPAFHHSSFYGYSRKPDNNKLLIRAFAYMVFTTLFRDNPAINIMHLAQAVVLPDAKEDAHIRVLEMRRLLALQVVEGSLRIQEHPYEGQGHPLTPYVRLNNNLLIQLMGGDKCMAVLNAKTIEAVREERQNAMLDTIEANKKKKAMFSGYHPPKPIQLPTDKYRTWKRRANGDLI